MALSLQNLFAAESEDFEDEDFLSVLEPPESCSPQPGPVGVRHLRPISHHAARCREEPAAHVPLARPSVGQRSTTAPGVLRSDSLDLDDEELLSACSELEEAGPSWHSELEEAGPSWRSELVEGGPGRPNVSKVSGFCLRAISHNWPEIPQRVSCQVPETTNKKPCLRGIMESRLGVNSTVQQPFAVQPHPSGQFQSLEPTNNRACLRGLLENQHNPSRQRHSPTDIAHARQVPSSGQCQSSEPVPKRTCLRAISENHPGTPQRDGPHKHPPTAFQIGHVGQSIAHNVPRGSLVQPDKSWQPASPHTNIQRVQSITRGSVASPRPSTPSSLQTTPVVTNHLVQLMTAANQTPRRLSWETPPPKERKFPGPAGLLPHQGGSRGLEEILVSAPATPTHGARAKLCTKEGSSSQQPIEEEFARGPWAAMKAELGVDERDSGCFLRSYSVVMVLRKAALKQLPRNKVPQMAVALKSLTRANGDASAVFRDSTGDIQGTIHHLLLEERESDLKIGNVLLLKQVGIFSPSHRNHYLNVTPSNLVKIYHPEECAEGRNPGLLRSLMSCGETDVNSNRTASIHSAPHSRGQTRTTQPEEAEDWDMDDLDSLLCDLPEDPGD
ncbi:homologous recombination OB-fold protein [Discoglossus pictus]